MPQKQEDFVVTDRRKFNIEGESLHPRSEEEAVAPEVKAETAPPAERPAETATAPAADSSQSASKSSADEDAASPFDQIAPPTEEETAASKRAYQATSERMEDLMRASNPGAPREPAANFERLVQSFYFTAIVQLGLNTPQGQQVRVDLLGAKQTIDLLAVLAEKTKGNLAPEEDKLLQSVLFELRMAFLEMTQALAQSAQAQAGAAGQIPKPKL
jgi:Domain of unknown function (DUF1844)